MNGRSDIVDPSVSPSITDSLKPHSICPRKESEEAKSHCSNTESLSPRLAPLKTLYVDPKRQLPRKLSADPKLQKSSTDPVAPASISENNETIEPNRSAAGRVSRAQVEEIARTKMPDLNAADVEAAVKIIEGTARSMGIKVEQ